MIEIDHQYDITFDSFQFYFVVFSLIDISLSTFMLLINP